MNITLHPIATITNKRGTPTDDFWGDTISEITLLPHIPEEAFKGIEEFSTWKLFISLTKLMIVRSYSPVDRGATRPGPK